MIQNPVCSFDAVYDMLSGFTEITIIRLNDNKKLYEGDLKDSITALDNYWALVVCSCGIYNNRTTGTLDIEVWDLTILEDPDL